VALGFVPNDVTVVVVNYALIPSVRRALLWAADHIGEHGGDADQITVSGHSTGAHIATMMLASDWEMETGRAMPPLRHVCALSGIFELEPIRLCFLNDVLGLQADEVARYSPRLLQR
jgi:arylformamidase